MQRNKISIAKKTLLLLENYKWNQITTSQIIKDKKSHNIKTKDDLLKNINKYFDFLLKENLTSIEKSTAKDMLFEVIMARLDIINLHRKAIKNLISHFISKPQEFIKLLPTFLDTIILISTISKIDVTGIKGIPKVKVVFILYLLIIYSWNNDETNSLEKTMTTLDKYLTQIDKYFNL
tara:strand:+ start:184 stop:717 length:534 start_codon:yes stop_codon:yes gene_type:complete